MKSIPKKRRSFSADCFPAVLALFVQNTAELQVGFYELSLDDSARRAILAGGDPFAYPGLYPTVLLKMGLKDPSVGCDYENISYCHLQFRFGDKELFSSCSEERGIKGAFAPFRKREILAPFCGDEFLVGLRGELFFLEREPRLQNRIMHFVDWDIDLKTKLHMVEFDSAKGSGADGNRSVGFAPKKKGSPSSVADNTQGFASVAGKRGDFKSAIAFASRRYRNVTLLFFTNALPRLGGGSEEDEGYSELSALAPFRVVFHLDDASSISREHLSSYAVFFDRGGGDGPFEFSATSDSVSLHFAARDLLLGGLDSLSGIFEDGSELSGSMSGGGRAAHSGVECDWGLSFKSKLRIVD